MKLHLCCGDVYLKDYINCDIDGFLTQKTDDNIWGAFSKKILGVIYFDKIGGNPNITTLDKYFKYPFISDTKERQKNRRPIIIDKQINLTHKWDFEDNSVDEIVLVSALEHFTKDEGLHIASEINRVTKKGAKVLISVPDLKATVDKYYEFDTEHCMTLVFCNWKNIYSAHKWMYSTDTLRSLMGNDWIGYTVNVINHDFPAIQMEFIKI